jgi:hypothetical protein
MIKPQTLTIHLLHGKPEGVKILEIQNKNLRMYIVPRQYIPIIKDRSDLEQPAIYFLINETQEKLYIGEAENSYKRISQHDSKVEWDTALICISTNNALDKASIKYLESKFINKVSSIGNIELSNKTKPDPNNLHEFRISEISEFQEYIELAITSLGFSFLTEVEKSDLDKKVEGEEYWILKSRKSEVKGIMIDTSFVILKGSLINGDSTESFKLRNPNAEIRRKELISAHCKRLDNGLYQVLKDITTFKSINEATGFAVGSSMNAWINWKNIEGKTIDEVDRKK